MLSAWRRLLHRDGRRRACPQRVGACRREARVRVRRAALRGLGLRVEVAEVADRRLEQEVKCPQGANFS